VHRGEYLDIADRVEPEFGGDPAGDDVDHEVAVSFAGCRQSLRGVAREAVEVAIAGELRGWPW
jgi:hypothetical protein